MGRADSPPLVYQDDAYAASASSAISLQDHNYGFEDEGPPAYSDLPETGQGNNDAVDLPQFHPCHPNDPELSSVYDHVSRSRVVKGYKGSTTTLLSQTLTSDPKELQRLLRSETSYRPDPLVRMVGTHTETRYREKKEEKVQVTDFDITLSMQDLLSPVWRRSRVAENAQKTYRGGVIKGTDPRIKAHPEATHLVPSLEEWCHRFCASSAGVKSFSIMRFVTGVDEYSVTRTLNMILRSTSYRGCINISYPVNGRQTTIMSDHPVNRYRNNPFIWWICVILQLWIFTWPVLWFMTRRWEVLGVEWPLKINRLPDGTWPVFDEDRSEIIFEGVATQNQDERVAWMTIPDWIQRWKLAIQMAAEAKKQGALTNTDREIAKGIQERSAQRATENPFGVDERGILGAATSLLRDTGTLHGPRNLGGWGYDT